MILAIIFEMKLTIYYVREPTYESLAYEIIKTIVNLVLSTLMNIMKISW